jgi:predicted Zn-dependent protease
MTKTLRMEQIEAMLVDEPNDEFLRYGLAMEHSSAGNDAQAAIVLQELIALNPIKPYIPAFLMAGQALLRAGDDDRAATVLKAGIEASTRAGTPDALHARGELQGLLSTIE